MSTPTDDAERDALDRVALRYRLVERIGAGGSSTVHRAWDEQERVFRAVKVLAPHLASNAAVRERLLHEAELMRRVDHPNVVRVHAAGVDGERVYLVLDLMPGGSVLERLAEGALPPRMAVGVVNGALLGLQAAHDAGVVHRDVKPHNLLLDADGTVKVTDFGIARADDVSMTRTGAVLGTLAYMPPEQKTGTHRVDARADLYAAGATLFALLTRRAPHDLYAAALDDAIAVDLLAGIPLPIAAVIRSATAFRPEDRYASAQAMSAALALAVADLPEDPPAPSLVDPERVRRDRALYRLGPTLLGTTESEEGPEPDALGAAPPALDPAPASSTAWSRLGQVQRAVLFGVGAAASLAAAAAGGLWVGTAVPRGGISGAGEPLVVADADAVDAADDAVADDAVDAAGHAADPDVGVDAEAEADADVDADADADADADPDADAGGGDAPIDEDPADARPARRAARARTADPGDDDPPSQRRAIGRWDVQSWPSGRRRADVIATLTADAHDGAGAPPTLIARCVARKVVLALGSDAGVGWLDDRATVSITTPSWSEDVRAALDPQLEWLVFPSAPAWIDRLLAAPSFSLAFPAADGTVVRARFTPGGAGAGASEVREALAPCL